MSLQNTNDIKIIPLTKPQGIFFALKYLEENNKLDKLKSNGIATFKPRIKRYEFIEKR